ncbi:ABC transporter related [Anaeromyxobacter dehalogenans 2CP-1]|uniref:ABC transporter related n=1 Tax=Anaeromyxobacter dehalogenans (strain ATCC BAA-258 / DSM 21875 / 2CP-1) TaxID=455488 RepID=B8JFE7_ANAD2|nr:ATP-binding cassette domain-containing protein [Anaeromyxobacter dehalogenans]ACL66324.1 ABC transporter related [Anaeromyxobacter dehalogenans 2CP-1]
MPSVRLERLSFSHADAAPILDAVDLVFPTGWTALVGENGAGKTTLLELVAGLRAPDAGRILLEPEPARVVLCRQAVDAPGPDVPALAARDDGEARRLRAALALDPEALARWTTLSPGERKRWQVGAALAAEPDVLLLDEPTNHADAQARALLAGALRRFGGAGVLVSHDRALLAALAARTVRLGRGAARAWALPYGAARAAWEAESRVAWDARAAAQEEGRRVERALADARRARDAADRARSGRKRDPKDSDGRTLGAKTRRAWAEDRLGADVRRLRSAAERAREDVPEAPPLADLGGSVFLGWERAPRPVLLALEADEVRAGEAPLLRDVHLRLGREDRVWLSGPNGAGKSTLLRALLAGAALPPDRLLYLPQELPDGEGPRLLRELAGLEPAVRGRVLSLVAALGTDPARLLASAAPSPGEARKLFLAMGMGRHAWALVLDEPTNHLDLPTVERLEAALAAYPGALLLVTHDEALAARCTASRWRIASGRVDAA